MEAINDYAAFIIIFLGSIQIIVLNFLAIIGSFTVLSWVHFQVHCLKIARQYQNAKIENGHEPVDFVTAFWRMKKQYQSHRISQVCFKFEKPED